MSCYSEKIVFSTSGPWGNDGWTSVSSMWCLNAVPNRYMKSIATHSRTHTALCCHVIWQYVCLVRLCIFRLWNGFMTLGSFTCPHTPPLAQVSITHRSFWKSMRTSTSQPRLASHTHTHTHTQACNSVYACVCALTLFFPLPLQQTKERVKLLIQLADGFCEKGHSHAGEIKKWVTAVDKRYRDFSLRMDKYRCSLEKALGISSDSNKAVSRHVY